MHWQSPESPGASGAVECGSELSSALRSCEALQREQACGSVQQESLDVQRPARQRSGQVTIAAIKNRFKRVRIIFMDLYGALYLAGPALANSIIGSFRRFGQFSRLIIV
jgi:hypothetical protein